MAVRLTAFGAGTLYSFEISGVHFFYRVSRTQGSCEAVLSRYIEKYNVLVGDWTLDLPTYRRNSNYHTTEGAIRAFVETQTVNHFVKEFFVFHARRLITIFIPDPTNTAHNLATHSFKMQFDIRPTFVFTPTITNSSREAVQNGVRDLLMDICERFSTPEIVFLSYTLS
jgi:hypothetical protein